MMPCIDGCLPAIPGHELGLWVLKNWLSRNSQKLHRVRLLYKRLSLFG